MFLALEVDGAGAHPAAWRFSGKPPAVVLNPAHLRDVVRAAEAGGFTFVTFADSPLPPSAGNDIAGRLEAGGRAAYVSTLTEQIGLAPTIHTTTTEPFHVAAQLASLDHASHGRAAWLVGAERGAALATVGATTAPDGEAAEVVELVRQLWDSWEDDAVIKDVTTGRYLDPDKVHHVDFQGGTFSVKGPLITPRPPQGQPVVLAPDTLDVGADVVLVEGETPADITKRALAARKTGEPLVFAELDVVLDAAESATERLARLDQAAPWPVNRLRHTGSAHELAQLLNRLGEVVDGVRLHPAALSVDLPLLNDWVLPAIPITAPRETLRETLGFPRPANRFATTRRGVHARAV
ncbi:LLM class flavin-dependent oxidoreductase [Amycolatopsis acidicola]|uniref:LLM class flavin-dependent oxidoreductase n=1 Tax=Amycolatopsis acidicola TaxID=2596893 RepID=A0A5N0UW77_9PSEU|nr:LLM class flavin-dependent oxidoreductase [Amycolatopsis acidicola]KAA9156360.1 LLM class flavin-dependent oxidoreductase [Amycolatopsis acidicola]